MSDKVLLTLSALGEVLLEILVGIFIATAFWFIIVNFETMLDFLR